MAGPEKFRAGLYVTDSTSYYIVHSQHNSQSSL